MNTFGHVTRMPFPQVLSVMVLTVLVFFLFFVFFFFTLSVSDLSPLYALPITTKQTDSGPNFSSCHPSGPSRRGLFLTHHKSDMLKAVNT